jgi:DNA repair protein RecN (Recombination protein N)
LRSDTVAIFWQEWKRAQKALLDGRTALASAQEELERLDWQISEIEKLAPGESEWEELNLGHSRLAHAQTLIETAHSALDRLENDETGALSGLSRAKGLLDSQTHVEPAFQELADVLRSSLEQAEDVAHSLHAYLRNANPDPERLQQLDQRITQWIALARRYRQEPRDLYGLAASWRQKRAQIDSQADIATLEANENNAREKYLKEAKKLSESRQQAAPRLAHAVSALIQELGMQGGRFEVALSPSVQPTASGLDEVSFLVAGHAGAAPRPVGKVASGGELSRIALAIAVTTSQLGEVQTLIFDEVDAGIGGTVAQTVGRLMRQLGMDRQVLAVTHLPQVAACADHHLVVTKQEESGTIASSVNEVVEGQRITEIARMIGGKLGSAASLAHAREMLEWGRGGEGTAHFLTP